MARGERKPLQVATERETEQSQTTDDTGVPTQVAVEEEATQSQTTDDTGVPTQMAVEEEATQSQTAGDARVPTQVATEEEAKQSRTAGFTGVPTQVAAEDQVNQFPITDDARVPTQVASFSTAVKESAQSSGATQDTARPVEKKAINIPSVGAVGGNTEQSGAVGAKTRVSSRPILLPTEQLTLASEQGNRYCISELRYVQILFVHYR